MGVREKQLPALTEKLVTKLKKAEEEKLAEAASALAKVPAPPPVSENTVQEPEPSPVMKAIPLVPGVLGQGLVPAKATMVTRAIESLQTNAANAVAQLHVSGTAALPFASPRKRRHLELGLHTWQKKRLLKCLAARIFQLECTATSWKSMTTHRSRDKRSLTGSPWWQLKK
eukprot:symbB.v1.2.018586.t1/scaffold1486.1/size115809/11